VSFITANGLRATASLGTFKALKNQWRKEVEKDEDRSREEKKHDKDKIDTEVGANTFLGGGHVHFEHENEQDRSFNQTNKLRTHDINDVTKAIDGELPVAVLNADQIQRIVSQAGTSLSLTKGTFKKGQKRLMYQLSLQSMFKENKVLAAGKEEKTEREVFLERLEQAEMDIKNAKNNLQIAEAGRNAVADELIAKEESLKTARTSNDLIEAKVKATEETYNRIDKERIESVVLGGINVQMQFAGILRDVRDRQIQAKEARLTASRNEMKDLTLIKRTLHEEYQRLLKEVKSLREKKRMAEASVKEWADKGDKLGAERLAMLRLLGIKAN
jgi:hypothetical protein